MEFKFGGSVANQKTVLGHPSGLFVLFFTEMWERFSYYGMRALLVLFLVSSILDEGWGWERADAMWLYGVYTGLVYITPIFGGLIADKLMGYRKAVFWGALIMTLGHLSMAFEVFADPFFYIGLILLILGNGLFKPNISSIVGQLYKTEGKQKDAGYTIFYMGINAGAFLGILLCGYIGEKVGWHWGFGLAGIFMFFGMLQFYFAQSLFGKIGTKPPKTGVFIDDQKGMDRLKEEKAAVVEEDNPDVEEEEVAPNVMRDRLWVIAIFAFFTIFFWWAFEQAGSSMTIFAKDYTDRILVDYAATAFLVFNTLLTIVPLIIITWVLYLLFKQTFSKYSKSNIFLGISFLIIWVIVIWMIQREFNSKSYVVEYQAIQNAQVDPETGEAKLDARTGEILYDYKILTESTVLEEDDKIVNRTKTVVELEELSVGEKISIIDLDGTEKIKFLKPEKADEFRLKAGDQSIIAEGSIKQIKENEVEVQASWFGILNSFFIIAFAPLFSRIWESRYNPSGPIKFAIGLILLGIGFAILAYGSMAIPQGAKVASVSMMFLVLAYLFHTLGELCLSPVGLSYVSKLSPKKLVGMMFGVWFASSALANLLGGITASYIDYIVNSFSMATFFMIFTLIPIGAGIIMIIINGKLIKMMHGIR